MYFYLYTNVILKVCDKLPRYPYLSEFLGIISNMLGRFFFQTEVRVVRTGIYRVFTYTIPTTPASKPTEISGKICTEMSKNKRACKKYFAIYK